MNLELIIKLTYEKYTKQLDNLEMERVSKIARHTQWCDKNDIENEYETKDEEMRAEMNAALNLISEAIQTKRLHKMRNRVNAALNKKSTATELVNELAVIFASGMKIEAKRYALAEVERRIKALQGIDLLVKVLENMKLADANRKSLISMAGKFNWNLQIHGIPMDEYPDTTILEMEMNEVK